MVPMITSMCVRALPTTVCCGLLPAIITCKCCKLTRAANTVS